MFLSFFRGRRWIVSLGGVEFEVPEGSQVAVSKKKVGNTNLELLREQLWLQIKMEEL